MGYANYIDRYGRHAGYAVQAHCDHRGCMERLDRGLDYMCGGPGPEERLGCQKFFCREHRPGFTGLCLTCQAAAPNEEESDEDQ